MKAEAFIIHLARASGRALQVDRIRETLPLPCTVIDAVDAQQLSDKQIEHVYRPGLHRPRYPFPLRTTEIACFLSHRKVWQAILDRDLDAGLIVEDDVQPRPSFPDVLQLVLDNIQETDVVRIPKQMREKGRSIVVSGQYRVFEPRHPGLGMQAQVVGRDAARALLAATETFDRPVDTTIQMCWLHKVRVLTTMPVCIAEIDGELGGTTIQRKSKTLVEIAGREFHRARYRLSARACNALSGR